MTECETYECEFEAVETLVFEDGTEFKVCVRHSQKSKQDFKEEVHDADDRL